jgi:eight-cysteine-cluster-containing protein
MIGCNYTCMCGLAGASSEWWKPCFTLQVRGFRKRCRKTGCGGSVCADRNVITTCLFRPEDECFADAVCKRQSGGACGFTITPEVEKCLERVKNPCMTTGCSGEVCAAESVTTTCVFRPEFECYQSATCEKQPDSTCAWTPTPELTKCLDSFANPNTCVAAPSCNQLQILSSSALKPSNSSFWLLQFKKKLAKTSEGDVVLEYIVVACLLLQHSLWKEPKLSTKFYRASATAAPAGRNRGGNSQQYGVQQAMRQPRSEQAATDVVAVTCTGQMNCAWHFDA